MAITNCVGTEYGGNLVATLFLGCTIADFQVTAGWNDQPTDVTVSLYKDDCAAPADRPKYYYDANLYRQTTTDADPGFVGEIARIAGCPVYFRYQNFEFCGIVQSWERENSSSVNPRYVVKLTTPIKVLQESQLILGKYGGTLATDIFATAPNNVFNVYGFAESFSSVSAPFYYQSAPGVYSLGDGGIDGAVFGTPAGGYGGANVNDNGMQWNTVRSIINVLTSAVPRISNQWTPHGRITHRAVNLAEYGAPWTNGYGLLTYDSYINSRYTSDYFLDISELPLMPSYFRFPNITISILDAINTIVDNAGYEYFLELVYIRNSISSGSGVDKVIKIRAVNRISQPSVGQISSFISAAQATNTLVASSIGEELQDKQTSSLIIGGNKQTIYQAYQNTDPEGDGNPSNPEADDMILPYLGKDISGNMIVPYLNNGIWKFDVDVTDLNNSLRYIYFNTNTITIDEYELLSTTSMKGWEEYTSLANTDSYFYITGDEASYTNFYFSGHSKISDVTGFQPYFPFGPNAMVWNDATKKYEKAYDIFARDMLDFSSEIFNNDLIGLEIYNNIQKDKETIYKWIAGFASNFGSKYAVRVPYTAPYFDSESQTVQFSETPTTEGWTEEANIIGLPHGTVYSDFFSSEDGRVNAFARFNTASGLELDGISNSQFLTYDGDLYIKISVDTEYVFHDYANFLVPRVVINLPQVITESEEYLNSYQAKLATITRVNDILNQSTISGLETSYGRLAAEIAHDEFSHRPIDPDAVCFGIQSNVNSYGPWSSVGPAGGLKIEKQEGLVPWEYGSYAAMHIAGNALANAGLSNTQYGEMGSVTVAGTPTLPIGAEINSASIMAGQNLIENRIASYTTFLGNLVGGLPASYNSLIFNYGFSLNGSYGPNVTSININVGAQGLQTTYNMRSYTPVFGRLAELNAQRLRQIGHNNVVNARQFRFNAFRSDIAQSQLEAPLTANAIDTLGTNNNKLLSKAKNLRKIWAGNSPHEILAGQNGAWQTGTIRSICSTYSSNELKNVIATNYEGKAFASLDAILRPFSMTGGQGLARYPVPSTGSQGGLSVLAADSNNTITGTGAGTASLSIYDYNPYFNPLGYEFNQLAAKHTGIYGHDIDIVARGNTIPENLILRHKNTGTDFDYSDNYRSMALKGPLLIHSWGYGTDGKPVPNENDNPTAIVYSGIYKNSGLSDNFYPDFGQRSDLWPVAPLEVYYDRGRGVWTFKEQEEIHVRTLQHIGPQNSGLCLVIDPLTQLPLSGQYLDTSGNLIDRPVVYGYDIDNNLIASGTKLRLKYNTSRSRLEINSSSSLTILLTGSLSAASWSSSTTGLTPVMFAAPTWSATNATGLQDGKIYYNTGYIVTGWHKYTQSITVPAGKGYITTLENGWLDNSDCQTITL